jgi:hypothetical protein
MRIHVALVASLSLALLGCEDRGQPRNLESDVRQPGSGGFTSEDNSAAYRPGDKGTPSSRQPKTFPDQGPGPSDAGLPADTTVPKLPGKPPLPPPPQKQLPVPQGKAGGSLH